MPDPICERCKSSFVQTEPPTLYCPDCGKEFREEDTEARLKKQRATPEGGNVTGKFLTVPTAKSFYDPAAGKLPGVERCGVCGSDAVSDTIYGHTVAGLGVHQFCKTCRVLLNFSEDNGD